MYYMHVFDAVHNTESEAGLDEALDKFLLISCLNEALLQLRFCIEKSSKGLAQMSLGS